METMIALLRGINVGGHRKVLMADLRQHLTELGLQNVTTYIQSGNIVFQTRSAGTQQVQEMIAEKMESVYGFSAHPLVLGMDEWEKVFKNNPYLTEEEDIRKLSVTFLSAPPSPSQVQEIDRERLLPDRFTAAGRVLYLHHVNGYGRTKLTHTFFEKKLHVSATNRNWKTTRKLWKMVSE